MASSSVTHASEAARRYASALFELAQDNGALSGVHESLMGFAKMAKDSDALASMLGAPTYSREAKSAALTELARKAGAHDLVVKFVGTMALNGRSRDIPGAANAFDTLFAKQRGVKRATVRTAEDMTDAQMSRIEGLLAKAVGGDVELTAEVDPALIGGIQLRIGSKLVDASIAAKLDRMNTAMKGA